MKIVISNLTKIYPTPYPSGTVVFRNLNLVVNDGEFICIVGPNGSGKTTLLNILSGLESKTSGEIEFGDSYNENPQKSIGYMMQKDLLLPWRTVYKNILLGLEIQAKLDHVSNNIVDEYINELNLVNVKNSFPFTLSGGERQKVSLIRTLVTNPDTLLLDEPFSAMDYDSRLDMEKKLFDLVKREHKTVLFVTHDIQEAIAMGDRVLIFGHKPNGIISQHIIERDIRTLDPISARESPNFSKYFSEIWRDYPK